MKILNEKQKSNLRNLISYQASACYEITGFVDKNEQSEDYWLDVLKNGKWKSWNGEKLASASSGNKLHLKNLDLYATSVNINRSDALVAVYNVIFCDRSNENEQIINESQYPDGVKSKKDIPFKVTEKDLAYLWGWSNGQTIGTDVFSVSTLGGDDIPKCDECNGRGYIPCETCNGHGEVVCEFCNGTGEMEYNAGNYSNGETKIRSKTCPHCAGRGRVTCPNCQGEVKHVCNKCNGSGKIVTGSCVQKVKTFDNSYHGETNLTLYINTAYNDEDGSIETENSKVDCICWNDSYCDMSEGRWLSPMRISRQYEAPGKLIKDDSKAIRAEALAADELKPLAEKAIKYIDDETIRTDADYSTVCVVEDYYQASPVTEIIVEEEDGSNLVFYMWEDIIWCTGISEVSLWNVLLRRIKNKLL